MVSEGSYTRFTLRHEDMCFLLDHRTTAMFGETTISDKNRDREWERFVKRNSKKGLVLKDGSPMNELESAIEPIRNYARELILTNEFYDPEKIVARAAFYSSSGGTTFARRASGGFRREYELEFMVSNARREEVLRKEFSMSWFRFTSTPFSYVLSPEEAEEALSLGQGGHPDDFKRWAKSKGIPFTDLALAMNVFERTDRIVIMGASEAGDNKALMITGSPIIGVMIKSIYSGNAKQFNLVSTSFDHLAEQSLWNYISDY